MGFFPPHFHSVRCCLSHLQNKALNSGSGRQPPHFSPVPCCDAFNFEGPERRWRQRLRLPARRGAAGVCAALTPVFLRPHPLVPSSQLSSAGRRERSGGGRAVALGFSDAARWCQQGGLRCRLEWVRRPAANLWAGPRWPREVVPSWRTFGGALSYTGEFTAASKEKDGG